MYRIKKIFNPEIFQGKHKKTNYFEGWYYKIIDSEMDNVYAVIPGVSLDEKTNDTHAFIQVLDAHSTEVNYFRFDISEFRFNEKKFEVWIGENHFTDSEIKLNLEGEELQIKGELAFHNLVKYPKKILSPGIMGPFTFIPTMECYHGIVNIHHEITGQLIISGDEIDFDQGYGYIEKDWGRSFPESWIWLQSNHFHEEDVSVMFSLAKIPWLGKSFTGLISFLRIKERIYLFATYSRAKVSKLEKSDNHLSIVLQDKNYTMELEVENSPGGVLKAPKNGLMSREISESIKAVVQVKLTDKTGHIIFQGQGINTGFEVSEE